jgi:hypothetical protein
MSGFRGEKTLPLTEKDKKRVDGVKGSRGLGSKEVSKMLKNYKELKVWQKAYELCSKILIPNSITVGEPLCGLPDRAAALGCPYERNLEPVNP